MELEKIENIWAIAGTVGVILATWYRTSRSTDEKIKSLVKSPPDDSNLVSQSLEISAIQTDMLNRLLERADENDRQIDSMIDENNKMKIRLNELEARNKQLEKYRTEQAEQISRLRARVAQLETELKRNDLTVPDPPLKSDKE